MRVCVCVCRSYRCKHKYISSSLTSDGSCTTATLADRPIETWNCQFMHMSNHVVFVPIAVLDDVCLGTADSPAPKFQITFPGNAHSYPSDLRRRVCYQLRLSSRIPASLIPAINLILTLNFSTGRSTSGNDVTRSPWRRECYISKVHKRQFLQSSCCRVSWCSQSNLLSRYEILDS